MRRCRIARALVLTAALSSSVAVASTAAAQGGSTPAGPRQADVERLVSQLKLGHSRVTVEVHGAIVVLSGTIETLWQKRQLVDAVRKLAGVAQVDSTLELVKAESDAQLAAAVTKAVRGYELLTLYDFIDGAVKNAVVTLTGAVTNPKKHDDLVERIEKIPGVRDFTDHITVLPLSPLDDQTRVTIADRIYSDPMFDHYSATDPPIHVIVDHGRVTLIGIVLSDIERRKAESLARTAPNVFTVTNQIQLASEIRR